MRRKRKIKNEKNIDRDSNSQTSDYEIMKRGGGGLANFVKTDYLFSPCARPGVQSESLVEGDYVLHYFL